MSNIFDISEEYLKIIQELEESGGEITPELEECAGGAGSKLGTGGMVTKLAAAKTTINAGVSMILANGSEPDIIRDILEGKEVGTLFVGKADK